MQAIQQKTVLAKTGQVDRQWHLVDADGAVLGRMAAQVAMVLMGKHRADYTPHVDTGDFVIVVNAAKVTVSGNKAQTKEYDYYTNHSGGRKVVPYARMMDRNPEKIISEAIRRMLPKSKLGAAMLSKLKVYAGPDHPHAAQGPSPMVLKRK